MDTELTSLANAEELEYQIAVLDKDEDDSDEMEGDRVSTDRTGSQSLHLLLRCHLETGEEFEEEFEVELYTPSRSMNVKNVQLT